MQNQLQSQLLRQLLGTPLHIIFKGQNKLRENKVLEF